MTHIGYPDRPVHTTSEDLFNVEEYIDGLCEFIQNCATPMTISIQGDWGSGKTSMMHMVRERLGDRVFPVWFNTWQFSQFDMGSYLPMSLMIVLLQKLGYENSAVTNTLGKLGNFMKSAAITATGIAAGPAAARTLNTVLSVDAESDYIAEITALKHKFQAAVNEKLRETQCKCVVVFVDDIDRLPSERAVELLEVLKLFLDCENCVFVLAVDYEVVTLGIRKKFGLDVSKAKGKSFFDKIIQLPFKVPVAQYDIHNYVRDALSQVDTALSLDNVDLFVQLIKNSVGFNPRSMKRLFNTFQLLNIISRKTVHVENSVRERVLFAIICMQMRYEGLYRYFVSVPSALNNDFLTCFTENDAVSKIRDDEKLFRMIRNDSDDEHLDAWVKRICDFMTLFVQAIQLDDDPSVSEEELLVLEKVLNCSRLTSVTGSEEDAETDRERAYRWSNRSLGKIITAKLAQFGRVRLWMPRKVRAGVKLSDAACLCRLQTPTGLDYQLGCYLSREQEYINVTLFIQDKSRHAETFFALMGDNPLDHVSMRPTKKEAGMIVYPDLMRLRYDDGHTAESIASLWSCAYLKLQQKLTT